MRKSIKRVVIAGQKGGIGKSTIARALAVALTQRGKHVVLADLDASQQTTTDWTLAREANEITPAIRADVLKVRETGFEIASTKGVDVIIYDCPGWSDQHTLGAAAFADLTILPTSSGADDLRPLVRLAYDLESAGIDMRHVVVALFRISSQAEAKTARDYIAAAEGIEIHVAAGMIAEGISIKQAHGVGQSAIEVGGDKQRASVVKLVDDLIGRIDSSDRAGADVSDWSQFDWSTV